MFLFGIDQQAYTRCRFLQLLIRVTILVSLSLHRCVLLHGLFEVWGHGPSKEEAAADATRQGTVSRSFKNFPVLSTPSGIDCRSIINESIKRCRKASVPAYTAYIEGGK